MKRLTFDEEVALHKEFASRFHYEHGDITYFCDFCVHGRNGAYSLDIFQRDAQGVESQVCELALWFKSIAKLKDLQDPAFYAEMQDHFQKIVAEICEDKA